MDDVINQQNNSFQLPFRINQTIKDKEFQQIIENLSQSIEEQCLNILIHNDLFHKKVEEFYNEHDFILCKYRNMVLLNDNEEDYVYKIIWYCEFLKDHTSSKRKLKIYETIQNISRIINSERYKCVYIVFTQQKE